MKISVIIPTLNEEGNIEPIFTQLTEILSKTGNDYEIIFSDGNSSDKTESVIVKIIERDTKVKLISTSRSFGQMAALIAGYKYCSGNIETLKTNCLGHNICTA